MTEGTLSTIALPPIFDQLFESINFQPHVFKSERSFPCRVYFPNFLFDIFIGMPYNMLSIKPECNFVVADYVALILRKMT